MKNLQNLEFWHEKTRDLVNLESGGCLLASSTTTTPSYYYYPLVALENYCATLDISKLMTASDRQRHHHTTGTE